MEDGKGATYRLSSRYGLRIIERLAVIGVILLISVVLPDPRRSPIIGLVWAAGGIILGYTLLSLPALLTATYISMVFDRDIVIARRLFARQVFDPARLVGLTLFAYYRREKRRDGELRLRCTFADGRYLEMRPIDVGESSNRASEANYLTMEAVLAHLSDMYNDLEIRVADEYGGAEHEEAV